MPRHQVNKCNECGLEVSTSGPHTFTRVGDGELVFVPHPEPMTWKHGYRGAGSRVFCSDCLNHSFIIDVEFDETYDDYFLFIDMVRMAYGKLLGKSGPVCGCGSNKIIYLSRVEVTCPACREGLLKVVSMGMS